MAEIFDFYVNDNRSITFKLSEPIMLEDNGVSDWRFHIPNTVNGLDATGWQWWLVYVNAKNEKYTIPLTLEYDYDRPDAYSIATYTVDYGMSCKVGNVKFSIEAIDADTGGTILHEWHTKTYSTNVVDTLQGNQIEYDETESDLISALLIEVRNRTNQLIGGATPEPKNLIADMIDPDKVYLYVGSESDESTGYWYYHNGTRFIPGGVYGAGVVDPVPTQGSTNAVQSGGVWSALQNIDVSTDTTLSVSGKPADAKAVGDALAEKVDAVSGKGLSTNDYTDAEKQKVTDATADLSAMTTATASDVGKALKAKTVTDGKVTEWEFGEAGGGGESASAITNNLLADFYTYSAKGATATRAGYKIDPVTGCFVSDSNFKTLNFTVTEGEIVKIESDFLFQFQNNTATPAVTQQSYRVGETYETGVYYLEVPTGAICLKISTPTSNGIGACYAISQKLNDTVSDVVDFIDDAEVESRLDMIAKVTTDGGPQLVDLSLYNYTNTGTTLRRYNNVIIDASTNRLLCGNPFGSVRLQSIQVYDSSNTLLKYNNGASNSFEIDYLSTLERINETTIVQRNYTSLTNFKKGIASTVFTKEYDGIISYIKCVLTFSNTLEKVGVTSDYAGNVYIPYGKTLNYNDEVADFTWNRFIDDDKFRNGIPDNVFNPWMQRSVSLTDNLLDDRKIDWNPNSAKYLYLKSGETIPVNGGTTIMCNKGLDAVKWLDANGVETLLGNKGANSPIEIPSGAVAITFQKVWASQITNGYEPVYIYYVNTQYPYDDVNRNPLPMAQLNGWDVNKNLYDQCIPEEDSEIVRMMKTFAIREINRRQDAFRFGTFNVYVNRQATNKEVIRKIMGTYGIDLCGFQESQNYQNGTRYNLGDYLKGWQFGYCSTAEEDLASARHIVSALPIISSEAFSIGTGDNTCLKCVIQMPRYKDYNDGLTTLSLYTYHGIVSSDSERTQEVEDILAKVALDTSDFIIVCGDTNDFSPNNGATSTRTHERWQQFAAAGLTPVHNGESSTITTRLSFTESIDNIFVSSNITLLYYNVINGAEWMYTPPGVTTPVPVSDHDFVYADLQFDFEAVISARNQEGN